MTGYVYILKSDKNGRYYIGSTVDIERRYCEHTKGLVPATVRIRPLKLMFYKRYEDIHEARLVEKKLKSFKSRKITEQIIADQEIRTSSGCSSDG